MVLCAAWRMISCKLTCPAVTVPKWVQLSTHAQPSLPELNLIPGELFLALFLILFTKLATLPFLFVLWS